MEVQTEEESKNRSGNLFARLKNLVERIGRRQARHLSRSTLLEESGSSWIIRISLIFIGIILVAFIIWSSVTRIDEVAVAEGKVVPSSMVRKIQHPTGGVVSEIMIQEGVLVDKGQTVIWFKSSDAEAKLAVKEIQKQALEAKRDRLQFFLSQINKNIQIFDPKQVRLTAYQVKIMESLKDFDKTEGEILSSQIEQLKNDLNILVREEEQLIEKEKSLKREVDARNILVLRGEAERVSLLTLKRQHQGVINELNQIPLRVYTLFVNHQENTLSEISRIDNELAQINKVIGTYVDTLRVSHLRVPVSGIVHNLVVNTPGEVVSAGQTIFEIVPREGDLIAEVKIPPKDIGHITLYQNVVLKFTAYDVSSYGSLGGFILRISPTTQLDENGVPFYLAHIQLDKGYIGDMPNQNLILPGMTLEANVRTGSKTVLQYLLKPIFKSGQQALRER